MNSTHLWLLLVSFHDFQIFPDRTVAAWSVEEGKHLFGLSLFRPSRQSNIHRTLPRRAKKDSNIPSPGRTRSVKYPTPGPTKTIKSPPHALPPHRPRRLYIDRCISLLTGSQIVGMKGTGNAGTWNRLIQFPAHGQIIPVKCNQISHPGLHIAVKYRKAGPKKGTIKYLQIKLCNLYF